MTCRIWSRSRMRRGSGNPRTLLSIFGVRGFSGKLSMKVVVASPAFAFSGGRIPSLVANASSTCWASAVTNWFFGTSRRCAHSVASSAELRPSIWRSNSTRKLAESSDWSEAEPDYWHDRRDRAGGPDRLAGRHCWQSCCCHPASRFPDWAP